ncbi:DUF3857 domain-containing protein [Panacibacter sp. DH6]|uniref:DUF3857 domain-containing protein n=1 Tax=Panacibacter microcysteis TaxID=2793269 RepID=A0A931E3P2_9BACT|nr:DUF3857 domain-containing protein [Panacibacter microcysteis]MBG9374705.1 DUF3857 domain-containing protein [Panacibacter microcysteis]
MRSLFFLVLASLLATISTAQSKQKKFKYGDITAKDFETAVYSIDSSADAVYLFDVGNSFYQEDNNASFNVVYQKHARIRLLKKSSFDLATLELSLHKYGLNEEKLQDLDAATYNIENGKVVVTKLDKNSLFKDKNGSNTTVKFTFPNIKEGSIIEYNYQINTPSPFYVNGWNFQGNFPRLWSQYTVAIPEYYDFVMINQGYLPYAKDTVSMYKRTFHLADRSGAEAARTGSIEGNVLEHTWAIENVPVLKKESYTTTLDNHIAKMEFQLSALRYPNRGIEPYMSNWIDFAKDLMKDEDFAEVLNHDNNWLNDEIKPITASISEDENKAKKIYEYVQNNYSCTDNYALFLSQPLKKTAQLKKGNVADINILLAAMLKNAGFEVHPVLLSTREHGYASETYPIMSKFNYVVVQATKNGKQYILDASDPYTGFNNLPEECYNGTGRVIAEVPLLVNLSPDSLTESKVTTVFMINDNDKIAGSFSTLLGNFESRGIRKKLKATSEEAFFKDIKKAYPMDIEMANAKVDSLKMAEYPLTIKYDIKFNTGDEDILYFNPMLAEAYTENPFKAAERSYPVEMSSCQNETYILNMEIPKGYVVEEMPKSARVMLNEDEGMFEYIIGKTGDRIQLRCKTVIKKATFLPEDYATLRDFFAFIVKKQAEQIVLKKQ